MLKRLDGPAQGFAVLDGDFCGFLQRQFSSVRLGASEEQVSCSRVPGLWSAITMGTGSFPEFPKSHGLSRLDRTRRWLLQRFPASRRRQTASCTTGISCHPENRGYRLWSFRLSPERGLCICLGNNWRGKRPRQMALIPALEKDCFLVAIFNNHLPFSRPNRISRVRARNLVSARNAIREGV